VAIEKYRLEEQERQARMEAAGPLQRAKLLVEEALRYGQTVPCPGCHIPIQKNHECMHMICTCGVHFCYVCGIDRYNGRDPSDAANRVLCGCDVPSSFIERNPGWGSLQMNASETEGNAALGEFHRRRMARFVRLVKEKINRNTWESLRQQHPHLLTSVFMGRSIRWEELDTAEHPQVGQGRSQEQLRRLEEQFIARLFSSSVPRPALLERQPSLTRRASRYFSRV
jgi:hypothetical protein